MAGRPRQKLDQAALEAAQTHIELLDSENKRIAQKSASEILGRVGLAKPATSKASPNTPVVLSREQLDLLALALRESELYESE